MDTKRLKILQLATLNIYLSYFINLNCYAKVLSEEAFKELEKQFPGQFLLKSTTAICRDCPGVAINLVSNRGGKPTSRARSHLTSNLHKSKSKGKLVCHTKNISVFFIVPNALGQNKEQSE